MAFKDKIDKLISYFDTDEVSDVEEKLDGTTSNQPQQEMSTQAMQSRQVKSNQEVKPQLHVAGRQETRTAPARNIRDQKQSASYSTNVHREEASQERFNQAMTTIVLKYPRKYDDAQEIVDLLIINECVLIDFQYMLDAQARRCLDFIDGASKVLYGSLQKVGSSMYLLTPANVIVNVDDFSALNNAQDMNFDFDMKRR